MSHPSPSRPRRRPSLNRRTSLVGSTLLAVALALSSGWVMGTAGTPDADAAEQWRDLTGRMAPNLTFQETAQGLAPGTKLASFRGKQVVVLAFWLHDCPHCKRELPRVQQMHELWHRSGLQVISVVHNRYPLEKVVASMKARGWTFPVARDGDGRMAAAYGAGRRPGFYVIGIDGRIKESNALSDRVVRTELSRWRLHELEQDGAMPPALKRARAHVGSGNYGAALRAAEAVGSKAGADAAVRAAVARLKAIAERKMQNRVERAEAWRTRGTRSGIAKAEAEYAGIVRTFEGTSLEKKARALQEQFAAKVAAR